MCVRPRLRRFATDESNIDRDQSKWSPPDDHIVRLPFLRRNWLRERRGRGQAGTMQALRAPLQHPDDRRVGGWWLFARGTTPGLSGAGCDRQLVPWVRRFVRSREGEVTGILARPRRIAPESASRPARKRIRQFPWRAWLVRIGIVAAIALTSIVFLVPDGKLIAGSILVGLGSLMVMGGYWWDCMPRFRKTLSMAASI